MEVRSVCDVLLMWSRPVQIKHRRRSRRRPTRPSRLTLYAVHAGARPLTPSPVVAGAGLVLVLAVSGRLLPVA